MHQLPGGVAENFYHNTSINLSLYNTSKVVAILNTFGHYVSYINVPK